jgi:hypothetical protein
MTEISPLRRCMIEDMTIRNLSPATQQSYIHAVSRFSKRTPRRLERARNVVCRAALFGPVGANLRHPHQQAVSR